MTETAPVAVVTGASRGVGKGIALALGEAGFTVYVTGRTTEDRGDGLTIGATADAVSARGGRGIAVRCDHAVDDDTAALFERVRREHGKLDVLVNNVFAIPNEKLWGVPFWQQPIHIWDAMHTVGLRSHYVASVHAAPLLIAAKGLVVNISSFAGGSYQLNVAYGVGKAGVDRLARDMARDFRPHGVTSVSLWPGIVRTEWVEGADELPFSTEVSESPELTGRAVLALFRDADRETGKVHIVAELAQRYGFTDIDGTQPESLRVLAERARAERKKKDAKTADSSASAAETEAP